MPPAPGPERSHLWPSRDPHHDAGPALNTPSKTSPPTPPSSKMAAKFTAKLAKRACHHLKYKHGSLVISPKDILSIDKNSKSIDPKTKPFTKLDKKIKTLAKIPHKREARLKKYQGWLQNLSKMTICPALF
jgi:hypothetical protein